jgi:hypothetical protein
MTISPSCRSTSRPKAPKAALNALEAVSSEVHESWKAAAEKIEELLEE